MNPAATGTNCAFWYQLAIEPHSPAGGPAPAAPRARRQRDPRGDRPRGRGCEPYMMHFEGITAAIDYEPAESTTAMFGGNSNWRGPIWFPVNYLFIYSLELYDHLLGADFTVEYPTGSGTRRPLGEIAADLRGRLVSIFTRGPDGRRPCFGWVDRPQHDPEWRDNLLFNEYFHGDNAAGLGASHQTGWTGIIADVIRRRHGGVPSVASYVDDLFKEEAR